MENIIFFNNTGYNGGAIFLNNCHKIILKNCQFTSNIAMNNGGGIYLDTYNTDITFLDCFIESNQALAIESSSTGGGGIFINQYNTNIYIQHCIL